MWVEVSPGVYAKQNTEIVVNVEELLNQLEEIKRKIDEVKAEMLPIPEDAPGYIVDAIRLYNEANYGPKLAELETKRMEIEKILDEIGVEHGG